MKAVFVLLAVIWLPLATYAQMRTLSGSVVNKQSKVLPQATIMLKKGGLILQYAISDNNGQFRIGVSDTLTMVGLILEISHLSFKNATVQLTTGQNIYTVVLEESATTLPDVKVVSRPSMIKKGDTTSYLVSSFARVEDRSIGDVLKRMPGITVDENGKIYYNGREVSNLYIHGDDVMDGRYNLATQAIKKELIQTVDVMQNHQPIRVLQNKRSSDRVAINLVLKDENSLALSGQATLGAGMPSLYDGTVNAVVLSKQIKLVNSFKANNSGVDYRNDLAQLGNSMPSSNLTTNSLELLSAGTVGNPDLPRRNYYFNRSAIVNLNDLINNQRGWQFRTNIQGFIDRQSTNYFNETRQYMNGDTSIYKESQQAVCKPYALQTAFTATGNKTNFYFTDRLSINLNWQHINAQLNSNMMDLGQVLGTNHTNITNQMQYMPALKNSDVIDVQWVVNYSTNKQRLLADTGLHADILNEGIPYEATRQDVALPTFSQQLSFSWQGHDHTFRQRYEAGLLTERQKLASTLSLGLDDKSFESFAGDPGNNLRWERDRVYVNGYYSFTKSKFEARMSIPLIWQSTRYSQSEYLLDSRNPQLLLNPSLSFKMQLNAEDFLMLDGYRTNDIGNITGVYRGTVLTNYRSLQANDAGLQSQTTTGAKLYYNFQRSIILFLFNAGLQYNKVTASTVTSTILTNNIQRMILLPFKNDRSFFSADAGISKYLIALKTTITLTGVYKQGRYDQFINGSLQPWRNRLAMVKATFDSKLFNCITLHYNGILTRNNSEQSQIISGDTKLTNAMTRYEQQALFGFSASSAWFVNVSGRQLYSQQPGLSTINYVFADLNIRYKCKLLRTDFEFDVINFTNIKYYDLFSINSNLFSATRYEVRGRMAMVKATFNF